MDGFVKAVFGKSHSQITLKDVEEFFQVEQVETSILEFKSGRGGDPTPLFKEIVAFLNTNGGLIVFGSPEDKNGVCKGSLELVTSGITKDRLLQKIGSNISPSPVGINIKPLEGEGGCIFLIDVTQSTNPPHQNDTDKKYYIRVDSESKGAPHGLVEAMFNKRKLPELLSNVEIEHQSYQNISLTIDVYNNSTVPADTVYYWVVVTGRLFTVGDKIVLNEGESVFGHEGIVSHEKVETHSEILPRGIFITTRLNIGTSRNASYLLIEVSTWSRQNDMSTRMIIYDMKKNRCPVDEVFFGGIKQEEIRQQHLRLELNS